MLVTVAAGALLWTLYKQPPAPQNAAAGPRIEAVTGLRIDGRKATKRIGNGPVVVVEFTDFQCPFCAKHARDTYPSIRRDSSIRRRSRTSRSRFRSNGSIRKPDKRVRPRSAPLVKVDTGKCTSTSSRIQAALNEPNLFVQSAAAIGLNNELFESCLMNEAAQAVAADIAEGERLNVRSTPTSFVGRIEPDSVITLEKRIAGSAPLDAFAAAIAEASKR